MTCIKFAFFLQKIMYPLLLSLLFLGASAQNSCPSGPNGALPSSGVGATAGGHSLQWTKALISKPAPPFSATAVINGEFKELSLDDFKVEII